MNEKTKRVRVSVANMAWYARLWADGTPQQAFGILNPKKINQVMALGGSAILTPECSRGLESEFGATSLEFDNANGLYDARFQIDADKVDKVFQFFANVEGPVRHGEKDPTLDIMAELSGKEFPGYPSILTVEEAKLVYPRFVKVVRQKLPETGTDTSDRAKGDMPTHRLFRIFVLMLPAMIHKKFTKSPVVKMLTDAELATTNGGSKAGVTHDGLMIQNNLFLA